MKVLIHSNSPWVPTGYGVQCGLLARGLAAMGHEVAISSFFGLQGSPTKWHGVDVLPAFQDPYGADSVVNHANHMNSDVVVTLCDVWVLSSLAFSKVNTLSWVPVDCAPMGAKDREWFAASGARPVAMARHGLRMLTDAGFDADYAPHMVDTGVFYPRDKDEAREELGITRDAFIVGINAANKGSSPSRKAFAQQFEAFARLRKKHDDALLLLHTDLLSSQGVDLLKLAASLGITSESMLWSDQYSYKAGLLLEPYVAAWYNACDVVSNATYGEGFGLPTLEAQACGVPVVLTDNSASTELCGSGWKVPGVSHWNAHHEAWWSAPDVNALARVYEKAYQGEAAKRRGARAVEFASQYEKDRVMSEYWKKILENAGG